MPDNTHILVEIDSCLQIDIEKMQKLIRTLMIITTFVSVIIFVKLYQKSQVSHLESMENELYYTKNLQKTVKTNVTETFISDSSKNVFSPPEELVVEENSLDLFPEKDQSFSVATEDQFQQLMKLRANKLQEICNRTLEFKRKFNFRSIYVLQVKKMNIYF